MDFSFLNTIQPCLVSVAHINENNSYSVGTSYGQRAVQHYELDYITWGEGYIMTNGTKIAAKKGSLFFRSPGMVVEGFTPYHCYFTVFDAFDSKLEFPVVMDVSNPGYIEDLFSELFNAYIVQSDLFQFLTRTYLMRIMLYMYNQWTSKVRFEGIGKSLRKNFDNVVYVREHIEKNLHHHFTLNELAMMSGFSRYYFCRIFCELTGETPIEYINRCRINAAKRLLTETDESVKEIMLSCGFDNESYFFRLFKRQVKVSPTIYRQNNRIWMT